MNESVISVNKLEKKFGKTSAVNGLNLQVPKGSVYGFLGRNGAGKTTTIKILLGLLDATNGTAEVLGLNPYKEKEAVSIRQRTGYVSENPKMYGWMKVKEIIKFTSSFYKTWDSSVENELLKRFNLDENKKVSQLSRGMNGQLALLLALSFKPELLLLDEPTSGLDAVVRRDFLESIVGLIQEEGRTVFFSSHQIAEVERVSDYVGIIDKGELLISSPIEDLKAKTKRIRIVFEEKIPSNIVIPNQISRKDNNREVMVVVKDFNDNTISAIKKNNPFSIDVFDLSLEDIFVAYVGGNV